MTTKTDTRKHTPGPWTLEAGRTFQTVSGEFYITYGKDRHGNAKFKDFCELDANARLIAAAPDLLAALELADSCFRAGSMAESYIKDNPTRLIIEAAIARARG